MNSQFDRFSEDAKQGLVLAQEYALSVGVRVIDTSYILLGFSKIIDSVAGEILNEFGLSYDVLKDFIIPGKQIVAGAEVKSGLSYSAQKTLELSFSFAQKIGDSFVGTEHILVSILEQDNSEGTLLIKKIGISPEKMLKRINLYFEAENTDPEEDMSEMMGYGKPQKDDSSTKSLLSKFTTNLTLKASKDELDPVIGREKEISRLISILNRRTKNNPVLIGEPGVGKTAIVEGLAERIALESVPDLLLGKKVLILDLPGVVAGTKFRGEFEERLLKLVEEAKKDKDAILFIDEIHNLVGAGAAEGAIDAANILKPALSRGEIQVIGATTLDEYRKYIEKDAALERRFQPIVVPESTEEETLKILEGIRPKYEDYHHVKISDEAIMAAATLSKRYISDRFLPDKAIDLIDEAASLKKIKKGKLPGSIKKIQKQIKELTSQKEEAVMAEKFSQAATLKQKEAILQAKLRNIREREGISEDQLPIIDAENIAEVISISTGVPLTRLVAKETESLLHLENSLKKKIIGQDEAVKTIASAIRRARAGVSDNKRPIGSFIFLGPTGVGKTELAKVLAKEMFGDTDALIKIDMSEFMEKHNISRLVGAPAGYVGYEDSGKLTEKIRRRPYSVVLLDEIEKAHSDVFNLLLQIFEDGYLTDAKGTRVDFRNTIIIMTSNIGAHWLSKEARLGFAATSETAEKQLEDTHNKNVELITDDLKKRFNPEFLNRLDKVIVFRALSRTAIKKIVTLQLNELSLRLASKNIILQFPNSVKNLLVEKGYDAENGARPMRRIIQSLLEDPLANGLLSGEFKEGDTISILREGSDIRLYVLQTTK
ncbi:MAG: ATP-dependent Clp protease ATP-binding subunit [bacterium]